MPLFAQHQEALSTVEQTNFETEKRLQSLIEANLATVFNCRFVATEFATGAQHAGRIDTLALSEDDNPVIIEYKKVESSELINQSLFYLAWMHDHRGDFEIAAQKALGPDTQVDWSDIRVICIAPNFKKYDLHAVKVMGANLELWSYRLFKNGYLFLEEVFKNYSSSGGTSTPVLADSGDVLSPGQKAAITRKTGTYTFEQHIAGKPQAIIDLAVAIQEFMLGLDPAMEEAPKKFYVAYRISQNIVCMEVQHAQLRLFLKLDPATTDVPPKLGRDVSKIGHYGTGNLELTLRTADDLEAISHLLVAAYQKVGG